MKRPAAAELATDEGRLRPGRELAAEDQPGQNTFNGCRATPATLEWTASRWIMLQDGTLR